MSDPNQAETLPGSLPAGGPSTSADPGPRLLGGRYLLEERIATGGMASVWRAHDEKLARTVAVKILHDHLALDEAFRERFRREAVAAAKLSHPNVVSIYDTGSDGDRTYLVMEFVAGVTLRDVIADLEILPPGQAAAIGEKVARALDYAHSRGLVHRDIKPANILIGEDGAVKVTDFGIVKATDEDRRDLTSTGTVLGTAAYVAPEQILGQDVGGAADQYALGCVLYETLCGRRPFEAESAVATAAQRLETSPLPVRSVRATVPRGLDAVVARTLARRPEDRFPSAGALADALAVFADADTGQTAALAQPADLVEHHQGAAWGPERPAEPAPAREPAGFLRSEGRWLAPVVSLLLLAGVLVAVGIATGVLAPDSVPRVFARDPSPAPDTPAPAPVSPQTVRAFDAAGDGSENDDRLRAMFDGDVGTFWRADLYNTPAFGNLKPGVGFVLDLGAVHRIQRVLLRTTTPGIRYEIRTAAQPEPDVDAWSVVGTVNEAAPVDGVTFAEGVQTRYVLVWITGQLQPERGRYTAGFAEVAVEGSPA